MGPSFVSPFNEIARLLNCLLTQLDYFTLYFMNKLRYLMLFYIKWNNEKFEREGKTTKDNKGNCQCQLSAQGTGWVVVHKSSADGTTKLNLSKRSPWTWLLSSPLWILLMPPYLHLQAATRAQILETNLLLVGSFWPRLKMDNQQNTSTHMPPSTFNSFTIPPS